MAGALETVVVCNEDTLLSLRAIVRLCETIVPSQDYGVMRSDQEEGKRGYLQERVHGGELRSRGVVVVVVVNSLLSTYQS